MMKQAEETANGDKDRMPILPSSETISATPGKAGA